MKHILLTLATTCIASAAVAQARFTQEECQTLAHENYPLIKQYDLIRQTTDYNVANAAKAYLPQISLAAQATLQSDVAAFPQQMTEVYQQLGIDMKGLRKDQYKIALEVNQTLWDGGVTRAQKDLSTAEGEISAQTVATELYTLRERIRQLYFGILIIEEQLRQNDLLQALLQSNYKTAQAFVRNGIAMSGDLNVIKAEQLAVSQQRIQIESTLAAYRRMLSVMTGGKVDEAAILAKPDIPPAVAPDATVNRRPELQLFAARSAQFDARKRAVEASVMPRLGIFAQGFYGNPGLNLFKDMIDDAWSWNYIAGIRLQWNIGNYYTKKGNLQILALAQRRIDNQQTTFLYNNALQEIRQRSEIEKMRKIMSDDDEIITLRTSIRRSSEAKYANGTITVNDLLRDITAENQALLHKSLHELEWLKNLYELKYITND
jgi:outer membrane protein TolC